MVKLKIDNRTVEVNEGTTILAAAEKAGVAIPTLCYNEELSPAGVCRICVVEVGGGKESSLVTSCNYPVAEGMIVSTKSEEALKARRLAVELLMAQHPHSDAIDKLAKSLGIKETRFSAKTDECILCKLCVRTCHEAVGAGAITFIAQGQDRTNQAAAVVWDQEKCIACGSCAFICPTEAVTMSDNQGKRVISTPSVRMEFPLKACAKCGNLYAPEKQVAYMAKKGRLPIERFELCPDCRTEQSTTYSIMETCPGCGLCVKICPQQAITLKGKKQPVELDITKCVRCGKCFEVCKVKAIAVK
jgi:bidirectional [NiFe] hydrogenase diaphorase subunit